MCCGYAIKPAYVTTITKTIINYRHIGKMKFQNQNIKHINNKLPAQIEPTSLYKMKARLVQKGDDTAHFADLRLTSSSTFCGFDRQFHNMCVHAYVHKGVFVCTCEWLVCMWGHVCIACKFCQMLSWWTKN